MAESRAAAVSIKSLKGVKVTKTVPFLGSNITISKLTVAQVEEIQEAAKMGEDAIKAATEAGNEADVDQLGVLRAVIRLSVEGGDELEDEDFQDWPIEDISKLAKAIMSYSGIGDDAGK